jgi:hypothetical protein
MVPVLPLRLLRDADDVVPRRRELPVVPLVARVPVFDVVTECAACETEFGIETLERVGVSYGTA